MHLRGWTAGLLLVIGCAPSVPRPAREPPEPDAGIEDLPVATVISTDARTDVRAGQPAGGDARVDARADVSAGDAASDGRGADVARPVDAPRDTGLRGDVAPPDGALRDQAASPDAPSDGGSDALSDAPSGVAPNAGDLVIDELLINPAGTDTNREWIEVLNASSFTLDLHLLHIADTAGDVGLDAGLLAPGGILVFGQSLDPTKNGGAPVSFSFGNVVSLNNGGDSISICLGDCATGLILDQVVWTVDLGAAYDGHAAVVGPSPGRFCPADQPFGTAASFGSPGAPNPPCTE